MCQGSRNLKIQIWQVTTVRKSVGCIVTCDPPLRKKNKKDTKKIVAHKNECFILTTAPTRCRENRVMISWQTCMVPGGAALFKDGGGTVLSQNSSHECPPRVAQEALGVYFE